MNRMVLVSLLIALIILALALLMLFFQKPQAIQSPGECKTLAYNGENKINFVFFSGKAEAEKYSDFLLALKPFSENKNSFNFFYIDNYIPECRLYQNTALFCYSKEFVKKAASCPNDYIFVIKKQGSARSSAYMNLMSINSNLPITVSAHELGHAFANLADEYVPAAMPSKSKNCLKSCSAQDSCFQGCSKEEYFRTIDSGIMRTLSSDSFGNFNEKLIEEKLSSQSKITGKAAESTQDCSQQKYYLIEFAPDFSVVSKTIETGCAGRNGEGDFAYIAGKVQGSFNSEFIFTDAQNENEMQGAVFESSENFFIKIPVASSSISLSKDNNLLSEINLQDIDSKPCKK